MKFLGFLYLVMCVHTLIHEGSHILAAKRLGMKILHVRLGLSALSFTIGRVSISPVLAAGYTEVLEDELLARSRPQILLFFEAGCAANLLLVFLTGLFFSGFHRYFGVRLGMLFFWANQLPFGGADLGMCLHLLRKKTRLQKECREGEACCGK